MPSLCLLLVQPQAVSVVLQLMRAHPAMGSSGAGGSPAPSLAGLTAAAERVARAGLQLDGASADLWAALGTVAAEVWGSTGLPCLGPGCCRHARRVAVVNAPAGVRTRSAQCLSTRPCPVPACRKCRLRCASTLCLERCSWTLNVCPLGWRWHACMPVSCAAR